jgi:asparagine synthase (glutamine-hydrolysing)
MCGVTGLWDIKREHNAETLHDTLGSMLECIQHRGPDDSGQWSADEQGVHLGHRRLSILDLSPLGHQPMSTPSGRYVTVFNGEIYNFRALRQELEAVGHTFRGSSDTEVMLAAFEQWGVQAALSRFIGMFAIALWDQETRTLYLMRDRFGKKPLYYGRVGGMYWFGSELKSLLQVPGFKPEVDRSALTAFMRLGCVPEEHCIYRGIFKVPAGTVLTISGAGIQSSTYWSTAEAARAAQSTPFRGTREDAVVQLEALILDAVKLRLESDVPLGAFLSGGVDSSIVVAMMQQLCDRPAQTFSIGFLEAQYNEAPFAKKVAEHLGTDHTELYVPGEDALKVVPLLADLYDEPFGDSSQIPTFLVSQLARRSVTVALSGDGGDELFAGYSRYQAALAGWKRLNYVPRRMRKALAGILGLIPDHLWREVMLRTDRFLPPQVRQFRFHNKLARLQRLLQTNSAREFYLSMLSQWENPERVVLGAREASHAYLNGRLGQIESYADWMMVADATVYLRDDILAKVDRASMGVSLEARTPLLDHRIYEFAWSLPYSYKVENGLGKWALRQVLYKHVPRELVERPKMGFGVPVDVWLRGPLKEWADDLLSPALLRRQGFLDADEVTPIWQQHRAGKTTDHLKLWNVLMFQSWLQRYRI